MGKFFRVLQTALCLFGGAVAGSILLLVAALVFEHDPQRRTAFIEQGIRFAQFGGVFLGAIIIYRARATPHQ